jgi:hypothetical protein
MSMLSRLLTSILLEQILVGGVRLAGPGIDTVVVSVSTHDKPAQNSTRKHSTISAACQYDAQVQPEPSAARVKRVEATSTWKCSDRASPTPYRCSTRLQ